MDRFYRNKRILIAGGAGFIGSGLARKLSACRAQVTIVDSFSPLCGANTCNLKGLEGKIILVKRCIEDYIEKSRINGYDIIFNCVGLTNHHYGNAHPEIDYEYNCRSGLRLLEALSRRKTGTRIVSIGSRSQYGTTKSRHVGESHPLNPQDAHALHKTVLEHYHAFFAAQYGLDALYARLTNVYGPGQRLAGDGVGAIGEIIKNALLGEDIVIYGSLDRTKDVLFVEDAVDALMLLGKSDKLLFRVYNIGGRPTKMGSIVDAVKPYTRSKTKVAPFPPHIKEIDVGEAVLKTDRMRSSTGWVSATDINTGMKKTFGYYHIYEKRYL